MYGDPRARAHIRVDSAWPQQGVPSESAAERRESLTRELWHAQVSPPEDIAPDRLLEWNVRRRQEIEVRAVPEWTQTEIAVDGDLRTAHVYSEGDDWVAIVELERCSVSLRSHGIPVEETALTEVHDLAPYLPDTSGGAGISGGIC